jgi:hypothetical protein
MRGYHSNNALTSNRGSAFSAETRRLSNRKSRNLRLVDLVSRLAVSTQEMRADYGPGGYIAGDAKYQQSSDTFWEYLEQFTKDYLGYSIKCRL